MQILFILYRRLRIIWKGIDVRPIEFAVAVYSRYLKAPQILDPDPVCPLYRIEIPEDLPIIVVRLEAIQSVIKSSFLASDPIPSHDVFVLKTG